MAAKNTLLHAEGCVTLARLHAKFDVVLVRCTNLEASHLSRHRMSDATWTIEMERLGTWLNILSEEATKLFLLINESFCI